MEKEKKNLYFINYDGRKDCWFIEKNNNYTINLYYKYYLLHGFIYDYNMVFNSLDDALKDLKRVSKPIKYINIEEV